MAKSVGDRVKCPDGVGVIVKINEETAYVELDRLDHKGKKVMARFGVDECIPEKADKK